MWRLFCSLSLLACTGRAKLTYLNLTVYIMAAMPNREYIPRSFFGHNQSFSKFSLSKYRKYQIGKSDKVHVSILLYNLILLACTSRAKLTYVNRRVREHDGEVSPSIKLVVYRQMTTFPWQPFKFRGSFKLGIFYHREIKYIPI